MNLIPNPNVDLKIRQTQRSGERNLKVKFFSWNEASRENRAERVEKRTPEQRRRGESFSVLQVCEKIWNDLMKSIWKLLSLEIECINFPSTKKKQKKGRRGGREEWNVLLIVYVHKFASQMPLFNAFFLPFSSAASKITLSKVIFMIFCSRFSPPFFFLHVRAAVCFRRLQ